MKDDLNSDRPPNLAEDALKKALDELIEGRSSRAETPREENAGFPGSAPGSCFELGAWLLPPGSQADPEGSASASKPANAPNPDALLAHASECPSCAEQLRGLFAAASPEEAAEVATLSSATSDWQRKLAAQLARTPHRADDRGRTRARPFYLWAGAGLAASLLLAAGLTGWWRLANTPERLLAEAYTHSRIFDLRMPGAGFAEVTPQAHLRGGATGRESALLLDARARIERHLESAPEDPHWLQLEARSDVLEERFDPAIDILDRLLAAGPVSSGLLVDDAAAYFQRGAATGSENDRATALEYLRQADELAPGDPVVLFNEAVVMEDRGQVMNAVETWNRYLRFERDSRWLAEGRRRMQALEQKLNQLKSHQSRMEQHLATPQAMRALAADPATLAAIDEELSSFLLPRLLDSAFPMPVDRSRGSPCTENCLAARTLLQALAASLERNHQDPWLTQFLPPHLLPPNDSTPSLSFLEAAHALAQALDDTGKGDHAAARQQAAVAVRLFHSLGNAAGEDRSELERVYALQRLSLQDRCYQAAHALLGRNPDLAAIQIFDLVEEGVCDTGPGTATSDNPSFVRALRLAQEHHYALLEMRARNMLGGAAVESGDTEDAWRIYLATIRGFYAGDYPPFRAFTILSGLAEVEKSTPRVHLALLLEREVMGVLELTPSRALIPSQRFDLAIAAIRAGDIPEAREELGKMQTELATNEAAKPLKGFLADSEIAMANLYLSRGDLGSAAAMLDTAHSDMIGSADSDDRRAYAAARGQLELALGHPEAVEAMLREAILKEEAKAGKVGAGNIIFAQQNRDLYAVLAGVWLAQGRSPEDVLALWERYRLRVLGKPVPVCPDRGLACLRPRLQDALIGLDHDRFSPGGRESVQAMGQVVLLDRTLLYRANAQGVAWTSVPVGREELLAAAARLERAASSPATSEDSVDRAARRVGDLLLGPLSKDSAANGHSAATGPLLLESDSLLGNLPWPVVETSAGPIGLHFSLEESPSLVLGRRPQDRRPEITGSSSSKPFGQPLVVGASVAPGESQFLPEVLVEARAVARFDNDPYLLLAGQATQVRVAARLTTAPAIHFAGHAAQQDGATRLLLAPQKAAPGAAGSAGANPGKPAQDRPYLDSDFLRKHPPLAARLAVFSACSTGKKEEGWNHGMSDIVDTLASLGVPDVVATRWQIDSGSAVPMMDAFYDGLAKGLSVPQALTAARQSLIRDPRYRHPYYWAAYYASGYGESDLSQIFHPGS
jgi:CHAT domain-containing protein/predicted Zn-dependent protease